MEVCLLELSMLAIESCSVFVSVYTNMYVCVCVCTAIAKAELTISLDI